MGREEGNLNQSGIAKDIRSKISAGKLQQARLQARQNELAEIQRRAWDLEQLESTREQIRTQSELKRVFGSLGVIALLETVRNDVWQGGTIIVREQDGIEAQLVFSYPHTTGQNVVIDLNYSGSESYTSYDTKTTQRSEALGIGLYKTEQGSTVVKFLSIKSQDDGYKYSPTVEGGLYFEINNASALAIPVLDMDSTHAKLIDLISEDSVTRGIQDLAPVSNLVTEGQQAIMAKVGRRMPNVLRRIFNLRNG